MPVRLLSRIPNKRSFLASALGMAGIPGLLERTTRWWRPMFVVLTYHRIAVPGVRSDPYYDPVISATPESFEKQMRFISRYYQPIAIDELAALDDLPEKMSCARKPFILVTFDDGYRDNFDVALPILRTLGIPAVFFVPSGFLCQPKLPWWDHVAYLLKRTRAECLTLRRYPEDLNPEVITLGPDPMDSARIAAISQIIHMFLIYSIPDEEWFLHQLQEQSGVERDTCALGRDLFMTGEHVHELVRCGMAVGAHGHSHEALARLDDDAACRELQQAKHLLESTTGREVVAVAYPFGWRNSFTPRTQELASNLGYRLGFSSWEGVNQPGSHVFEPLCLRRLNVGTGDSGPLLRARAALHGATGSSFL